MTCYNNAIILHYNLKTKLRNELYTVYKLNYDDFVVTKHIFLEEGAFILYSENKIKHILGIIPKYTYSIYSKDEEFIIVDFTKRTNHFIHDYILQNRI